jgi:hypothetical protein
VKNYLLNLLLGLDYFASCLTGGKPGTTLSGRAGSAYLEGKYRGKIFCPVINFIMWNKQHCQNAVHGDVVRAQAVILDQGGTV